ncbi:lytic transglycosylase domain-containing protein (plasmid) [Vibrio parahaemolyticus]|uniref:lytic transglycosylase domain-containing protein n=1 Tax=Vibrio parahaemolyticus TaxID=670 RepID=UPI0014857913|nr:lytic transglycosylase domain-containing protein [Vibrio parahaemolyticus]NNU14238.1 lytic transglycosylase domain-containing protein [Vibrio parahaemolyticus]
MMDIDQYSHCIYQVHPTTIEQVIKNESNFRPLAINVNALPNQKPPRITQPKTKQEAIQLANYYVSLGHSVDLGLMQINSKNLAKFGVTIADMFTPCKNINVGSSILYQGYQRALKINSKPSIALQIALSYYNTGSPHRGFRNGYVKKYVKNDIPKRVLTAPSRIPTQGLYD